MTTDPEWTTPEIRAAQARVEQSAQAVHELAERLEREGLPKLPVEPEPKPAKERDDDDGDDDGNIVLRHSSW